MQTIPLIYKLLQKRMIQVLPHLVFKLMLKLICMNFVTPKLNILHLRLTPLIVASKEY